MRDIVLEETIYPRFTTRAFATGIPTTLAGTPVLSVYEENNLTQITAGVSVTADYDSVTGLNQATIVATAANGYESGKSYDVVITAGTVGGVSVVGEVVCSFTVEASAAAQDLANGTDGLGAIKTQTAAIETDTQDLQTQVGTAGAGLTNLGGSGNNWNVGKTGYSLTATTGLGNQTANITGNLSGSVGSVTAGVSLAAGAVTNASLAENMEIVFETDFATNYNTTDNGWVTNGTSFIGTGWNTDKTGYSLAADQSTVTIGTVTTNTDMRGTDNAALATALATAQTDLDTLTGTDGATLATTQANYAPAKAGDSMDVLSISGSATAADNLELSALTIIPFTVTGTPTSTEVAATGLTAITGGNDTLIGRVIIFTSGNAQYEAARITDYVDATGAMTVTSLAVTPSATDTGIII